MTPYNKCYGELCVMVLTFIRQGFEIETKKIASPNFDIEHLKTQLKYHDYEQIRNMSKIKEIKKSSVLNLEKHNIYNLCKKSC